MRFIDRAETARHFSGKSVAVVGSGPGCRHNEPGFIDSHDIVVRVNNYRLFPETGSRTDAHFSFYGNSIRKDAGDLKRDGVWLCMCKCPDADHVIDSEWHRKHGKPHGTSFRYIYRNRRHWWFCDTYVPTVDEFMAGFELLGGHIPSTGFAAILDVLSFEPASVYLTGFDFFQSGIHNVTEPWRMKNMDDPIRHMPEREAAWLAANWSRYPLSGDDALRAAMDNVRVAA